MCNPCVGTSVTHVLTLYSHHLPKALLTAPHWRALIGNPATAGCHLAEAQQIAERGPMPLYLADFQLHHARLFHDKAELAKAQALITQHAYGRRYEELAAAEDGSATC